MKLYLVFIVGILTSAKGTQGNERISGGSTVTIRDYPFAAGLLSNSGSGAFGLACGGSILTQNAILSAASCFFTGQTAHPVAWWRARVGSSYSNAGGTTYLINRITPHSGYSSATRVNDIAVIRTTLTIIYQPGAIEPARIVGAAYSFANNQAVFAIGWGATSAADPTPSSQLRQVQMWVVNPATCAERYREVNFAVTSNMVCIGWLDVGVRGQCQGDGGSPIVDNGAVVGVFSWSQGCGQSRFPGINTMVAPYSRWIVSTALAA